MRMYPVGGVLWKGGLRKVDRSHFTSLAEGGSCKQTKK